MGMLLSCTTVMGADIVGLDVSKNLNDEIEFSKGGNIFEPESSADPYIGNNWDEDTNTYTNNTIISGDTLNRDNSGIKITNLTREFNFKIMNNGILKSENGGKDCGINMDSIIEHIKNNGLITGYGYTNISYAAGNGIGIDIAYSKSVENIINTGLINGIGVGGGGGDRQGVGSGIKLENSSSAGNITNNGTIKGTATGIGNYKSVGSGIYFESSSTGERITNSGVMIGNGSNTGYGIRASYTTINALINNGVMSGSGADNGYGLGNTSGTIKNPNNLGVIYGNTNAVLNDSGTVDDVVNYGILANKINDDVVEGADVENYGLIIKNGSEITEKGENKEIALIVGYENGTELERKMTIKNKAAVNGLDSFTGNQTDSILNALENTYKVDTDDKVTGSIINSYGNAVLFDEADKELTLSGTIVNGGIKNDTFVVKGSGGSDTLILVGEEVAYEDSVNRFQNTIINGKINMGEGADILTIMNGVLLNGTLDGGSGNDVLNFGVVSKAKTTSVNDEEIRILHNISNFNNININSNVTFYEKTIDEDGKLASLEITGAENITIGENGILTLRIDTTNGANTHALSTNIGGTITSTGGKLLLTLNGAGNDNIIDFGGTFLDKSLVTGHEGRYQEDITFGTTSALHSVKREIGSNGVKVTASVNLPSKPPYPDDVTYKKLNKIYHSILSVDELGNFNVEEEQLPVFLGYLNDIYAGNPYSYSSELSRKSVGMFRDIVVDNIFKPETNKWMIYGGFTHVDGGTKDTYYGKGYYTYDVGSSDIDADTKITGAYMLGEYGMSDTFTSGVIIGGNKLKSDLSNGSKVDGSALYLGAYAKKYIGNLKVTAGVGFQYGDYDADRMAVNKVASNTEMSVVKYSSNYNDMTYDIYLNGRYSHNIGENLFLEPYATLSYTYIKQDGADEENKTLAIETDSKSFDYTSAKVGLDLKKVIPHEKGKSTLSAGVSYTRILDGSDEEYITGRFKGGSDFDILVAHKNEHNIGLNVKYALELENGILFDIKGSYSVERDSHNNSGKNRTKGEWIVGAGLGYKF